MLAELNLGSEKGSLSAKNCYSSIVYPRIMSHGHVTMK